MVEYHTHIAGIEAKDLGKELANTQYWYQGDTICLLTKKLDEGNKSIEQEPMFHSFLEPGRRTVQGLYVVERNLRSVWNCCKNHKGNEKHPTNVQGLSVEDLVSDLNDGLYGYDYIIKVTKALKDEWLIQSQGDKLKGRVQLSSKLMACYRDIDIVIKGCQDMEHQYQLFMLLASSN